MRHFIALSFAAWSLAGCGGGATSGLPSFEGLAADELVTRLNAFGPRIEALDVLDTDTFAPSGTLTHRGVLGLILNDSTAEGGVGEFVMAIDLSSGNVTGRAGNFVNLSETAAPGTLDLRNGRFNRVGVPSISADVVGTVAFERGTETFDLEAFAPFGAPDGEVSVGFLEGTGRLDDGTTREVEGFWFAEEQ